MNKIIKNKIIKGNLLWLILGLLLSIGGAFLNIVVYDLGWMVSFLLLIPIIGIILFFVGIYGLVYYPSNPCFKCWKKYGKNDEIVDEIMEIINKEGANTINLIFSDNWIIQPSSLIFVKPRDINWVFVHREGGKDSNTYNQKIKIFTNFKLEFVVPCSPILSEESELDNFITNDVDYYFTQLKNSNEFIVFGYNKELEKLWREDSNNFFENAKNLES